MNALDATALDAACREEGLPWRVQVFEEIDSTSDLVREAALAGEGPGLVIFAESQRAGRGRRENRWLAPKGKDLMFSLLLQPAAPPQLWSRLTSLAALAICQAIEDEFPLKPEIKWPNDIFLNDLKVSGLLAEVVTGPSGMALVLGIGLNVNTTEFPPELSGAATSVLAALGQGRVRELDRQQLALVLLRRLEEQLQRMDEGFHEAIAEVRRRSWLLNRQIRATVEGRELFGRAVDINAEGHLILALQDGALTTLSSADGVRQVVGR